MLKRKIALAMAGFMAVSAFPMNVMAEENGDKVNLTVMCAYASEDPHGQYVYQYADKFMEENPNVNIEIQAVSSNDIYTKLAAMATSPMIFQHCSSQVLTRRLHYMIWDLWKT